MYDRPPAGGCAKPAKVSTDRVKKAFPRQWARPPLQNLSCADGKSSAAFVYSSSAWAQRPAQMSPNHLDLEVFHAW
jgi:hypothetical protein